MSIEFMSALIGGFVAAAVTMTGWFVTDYLRRRDAMDTRIANFIEQQIMELYAPLYFLAESEYRYRQMRERAISAAPDDKQGAVWWEYSEKFIVPTQLQIYELLKTKWYLLIEGQVHQSIYEVINHCTDALSLFMLDKQGVKINNVPAQTMPDAFVAEIRQDLDSLRHEYDQFQGSKRRREARQASANFPT